MAARAIWKGVVRFADVELPVKLYSAVEDRKVHFRLLDTDTDAAERARVHQRMVDPASGDAVPTEEVRKGYEVEPGVFVVLEPEELEALAPEPSREIEVTRFVAPGEIDPQWYERPYYLGPEDGEAATRDYFALAEALRESGTEGVARWVMRKRSYVGALRREGDHLMLVSLRRSGEVVPASALEAPGGRALEPQELAMAEQLISALEGDFDPERHQDEYRERVMELVESKAEGRTIELAERQAAAAEPEDLRSALEASIARFGKGSKGGQKAAAKAKPRARKGESRA